MASNQDLPFFKSINDIENYYKKNKPEIFFKSFSSLDSYIKKIIVEVSQNPRFFTKEESAEFDFYSRERLVQQTNEACNKLWATLEFLHGCSKDMLFQKFNSGFSSGTIVPGLYYSQLSSMVSILCCFGCISFRNEEDEKNYFLIKTNAGWKLFERSLYIQNNFNISVKGWHVEVNKTYQGLLKLGYKLPNVDLRLLDSLRRERNKSHYNVLGSLSMADYFGLDDYFKFLPFVLNTINESVCMIKNLDIGDRGISDRFDEICSKVHVIYDMYAKNRKKELPSFCKKS